MNISTAYNRNSVTAYQQNTSKSQSYKEDTPSFSKVLDQVTISQEAKAASNMGHLSEVSRAVTERFNSFHIDKKMPPPQNYDAWLPENRAQIEARWKEQEEIAAAESDPAKRSDEMNRKSFENFKRMTVLETFGETMSVTESVMTEGMKAVGDAHKKYADAENKKHEAMAVHDGQEAGDSVAKLFLSKLLGKPYNLEGWQTRQFADNNDYTQDQ